MENHKRQLAI